MHIIGKRPLIEVLFADAAFSGRNKGMELGEERDSPHEIAAHDRQDGRRSPEYLVFSLGGKEPRCYAKNCDDSEANEDGVSLSHDCG